MSLAEISTILAWATTTAYAIGLVAFALDLATLAERRGAKVPELVAADGRAVPGSVTDAALAVDATGAPRRRAAGIAMSVTTLGAALQLAALVTRGVAAGRVPWANMYEFTLMGTFVAVAAFLALCVRRDLRFLGTFVVGLSTLAMALGLVVFYTPAAPVEPALQSYWLVIHVSIATIATGLFTVGVVASVLQLLRDSRDHGSPRLAAHGWGWLDALPAPRRLEALSFRINAVGFVLWTFTLVAGSIWAEAAWGRYWGWDPKEVWTFVVWVVYAGYLHARTTRGWSGRRAAWFVVVGYATVIFNFTGVNLLFDGLHSYADVPGAD